MSLHTVEIHAPDFDWDIDGGIDHPSTADQNIPTGPDASFYPDFQSNQYQLPHLLSDRPSPECISCISFKHSPGPKKQG